jgi:VanZ family protein
MAAIFIVSGQTSDKIPSFGAWDFQMKKLGHFLAYAILAILARHALSERRWSWLWAWMITAGYAMSDEFHQSFVPGRRATAQDVVIDCLGGMVGLLASYYWQQHLIHRLPLAQLRREPEQEPLP